MLTSLLNTQNAENRREIRFSRDFQLALTKRLFKAGSRNTAILSFLLALTVWIAPVGAGRAPNVLSPLGINLNGVTFFSPEIVFVDIFKQSQPWQSQQAGKPYGKGGPLALSPSGWVDVLAPGQFADSLLCRVGGHYPAGRYLCLYDGTGVLEFGFDAAVVKRERGRIFLDVFPTSSGIVVRLKDVDPSDPIRNIRLILPGFEGIFEKEPFHPDFLNRWSQFKVIRFMDWMRTNNSRIVTWLDRPTTDMQTQAGPKGVALEYMIMLANKLKADPWFCMPHEASYDYVRNFAQMVKDRLDPTLKVYVEYSNEVWNDIFDQARYCIDAGKGLGLANDPNLARLRYYSKRSVEIFTTWEEVFGGTDRLVRVLSSQFANPWATRQILHYEDAYKHADVLAVAPYFGQELGDPKRIASVSAMSVDDVLDYCTTDIRKAARLIREQAKEATACGLHLVAYEGGQHLVGFNGVENIERLVRLFISANRHPRMKILYLDLLRYWKKGGGRLFTLFSSMSPYNKWGCWGLLENMDQDVKTAPKYQAALEFINKNPAWW